jgi:virginiamycin B lyase
MATVVQACRYSAIAFSAALFVACGGGGGGRNAAIPAGPAPLAAPGTNSSDPLSQSPASFDPGPMEQTGQQPASEMEDTSSSITPDAIGPSTWRRVPGAATKLAVAPNGSLWALSTLPAGVNKHLWHYANGRWTNVPGLAASIAVGRDGTLYAVNGSNGGIHAYNGSSWKCLGGGARSVTTGADGAVYVLSNAHIVNGDSAIWKYAFGRWTQQPGAGAQLAGSFDPKSYAIDQLGTLAPNGYFVITAAGAISYYSPGFGYVPFAGTASAIAPFAGGAVALNYPSAPNGESLSAFFYDDLGLFGQPIGWQAESGTGVSLAAGPSAEGPWTQIYITNAANAIWTEPFEVTHQYPISAAATNLATGPDGALWFTENGAGKIGRIAVNGKVTAEYPTPTVNSDPYGIAAGPDGALWFTENGSNKIGRITTRGAFAEFAIPTAASGPLYITAGPDGALWFTENGGNKIGRITTRGVISEYPIPTASSAPRGIAAGRDGALWFVEAGAGNIGRITTRGAVTAEYPTPTQGNYPEAIVAGPDGALWFTAHGFAGPPAKIGRITTAGQTTEFAALSPSGIAAGPDGALWFTTNYMHTSQVGRMTTGGIATYYWVAPANSGGGITAGPDGAMWFTDQQNGEPRIARVALH